MPHENLENGTRWKVGDCGDDVEGKIQSLLIVVKLIAFPPITIRKGLSRKWEEKSYESTWISLLSFCSLSAALIRWFHFKLSVLSGLLLLLFYSNLILCNWGTLTALGMRSGVFWRKKFYNFEYQRGGWNQWIKIWALVIKLCTFELLFSILWTHKINLGIDVFQKSKKALIFHEMF